MALLSLSLVEMFYEQGFEQTLEAIALKLDSSCGAKIKTKIRRLYDISNVFKAMGLVKKVITKDRKVAIEWLGRMGVYRRDRRSGPAYRKLTQAP